MRAAAGLLAAAFAALAPAQVLLSSEGARGVESRQSAIDPAGSGVTTANGTAMDMAAWDRDTSEICTACLSTLDAASNPSGTAICYNIPMLNNQTGRFLADLRLYRISDPVGAFLGVLPQNLGVGVAYNGATVLRVDNNNSSSSSSSDNENDSLQAVHRPARRGGQADCGRHARQLDNGAADEFRVAAPAGTLCAAVQGQRTRGRPRHHARAGERGGSPRGARRVAGRAPGGRGHHRRERALVDRGWGGKGGWGAAGRPLFSSSALVFFFLPAVPVCVFS
jgi:hypothetical protein